MSRFVKPFMKSDRLTQMCTQALNALSMASGSLVVLFNVQ